MSEKGQIALTDVKYLQPESLPCHADWTAKIYLYTFMGLYLTKYEGTFREEAIKMQLDICSFILLSSLFPNHLQGFKAERTKS